MDVSADTIVVYRDTLSRFVSPLRYLAFAAASASSPSLRPPPALFMPNPSPFSRAPPKSASYPAPRRAAAIPSISAPP